MVDSTIKNLILYYEQKGVTAQNISFLTSAFFITVTSSFYLGNEIPPNRRYILDFITRHLDLILQADPNGVGTRNTVLVLCAMTMPHLYEKVVNTILAQAQTSRTETDIKILPDHIRNLAWSPLARKINYMPESLFLRVLAVTPNEVQALSAFAQYVSRAGYSLETTRSFYSRIEKHPDLGSSEICGLMNAYAKSNLPIQERKMAIQRLQKNPTGGHLMPPCTLIVGLIKPDLFSNLIGLADQYVSNQSHEPYVRGGAILVYGLSDLPFAQRKAKIESVLRSNQFSNESMQALMPYLIDGFGITNIEQYMEILRIVATYRQIEDESQIGYVVNFLNTTKSLSDAQKAEIRRLFHLPKEVSMN
ncbi:MAG: hypothetical protein SGI74_08625 [Oligoflexia bacterium]|nr:hypothetical protein [Oligoflexia bacterium]